MANSQLKALAALPGLGNVSRMHSLNTDFSKLAKLFLHGIIQAFARQLFIRHEYTRVRVTPLLVCARALPK